MELKNLNLPTRMLNALKKKHIHTVSDFLEWSPKKYLYFGEAKPIEYCQEDEYVAVKAKQLYVTTRFVNGKKKAFLAFKFQSSSGFKFSARLFERVYELENFKLNNKKEVVICGRFKNTEYGPTIEEILDIFPAESYTPKVFSIYRNIKGVSDDKLAELRRNLFEMQPEIVERDARNASMTDLMSYQMALYRLHFPENREHILQSKKRLLFNDLLYFNLSLNKNIVKTPETTTKEFLSWRKTQSFISSLPYKLTDGEGSQRSVLNEMLPKIKRGERINMLLQGDVGCGKTIIAATLMMYSAENGYQSVLMAPRDVLARQHYEEIKRYADAMGFSCVFMGGKQKASEKRQILKEIADGSADFIIGTHACIAKNVVYHNLGAVITDEEHLFGVEQKEALVEKALDGVHNISMSATPIPRTMATIMYGEQKEIRIISKKPAGRLPILTTGVQKREEAFSRMEQEILSGHQCYVVCPAIEENDKSDLVSLETIEKVYRSYFEPKGIKIGIVNGKLKKEEVEQNIADFVANETQILLSTTVIEVGVNVPNSTVMVIEQADRFGLATLHQLRGRVGRNSLQSYCILICEDPHNERINVMCKTNDGFKIAEADLEQRGTGDLLGTAQSGLNDYVEKMLNYPRVFEAAKRASDYCVEKNLGHFLLNQYNEHLELDKEVKDAEEKKPRRRMAKKQTEDKE